MLSVLVTQSCPTLCNPMDCSPPGTSVHEISQARILEWVAISFSRASSQPRGQTRVSCTAGRFFTSWATREAWTIKVCIKMGESTVVFEEHSSHISPQISLCSWTTICVCVCVCVWERERERERERDETAWEKLKY